MNESKLCTIEQIEQFLIANADVTFTAYGGDLERYAPGFDRYHPPIVPNSNEINGFHWRKSNSVMAQFLVFVLI